MLCFRSLFPLLFIPRFRLIFFTSFRWRENVTLKSAIKGRDFFPPQIEKIHNVEYTISTSRITKNIFQTRKMYVRSPLFTAVYLYHMHLLTMDEISDKEENAGARHILHNNRGWYGITPSPYTKRIQKKHWNKLKIPLDTIGSCSSIFIGKKQTKSRIWFALLHEIFSSK